MRNICRKGLLAVSVFVAFLTPVQPVLAEELRIMAIGAMTPLFRQLIPEFERTSGHRVSVTYGPTAELAEHMSKGAKADAIFGSPNPVWDRLVEQGKIESGTDFARFGMGIGVRKGEAKPDVGSSDALRQTLLRAKSPGWLSVGVGLFTQQAIRELQISDQIQSKVRLYPNGSALRRALVSGECDVGISVEADLAGYDEIDYVGPFPSDVQKYIAVRAALTTNSASRELAQAFINFVVRPDRAQMYKTYWLEPRF